MTLSRNKRLNGVIKIQIKIYTIYNYNGHIYMVITYSDNVKFDIVYLQTYKNKFTLNITMILLMYKDEIY